MKAAAPPYRWDPADYARNSASQAEWARELMERLDLRGDEWILDVGCGDGKVSAALAARVPGGRVTGIDASAEMVAFAAAAHPPGAFPNLEFVRMDARRIRFRERYDRVFSNAALHWIVDHRPVLAGIHAALKPSGRVLVQMGGRGNAAGVVEVLDDLMHRDEWRRYFSGFTFPYGFHAPENYAPLLSAAGFEIRRMELLTRHRVHADLDAFRGWIRTQWLPYTSRVPEGLRPRFIDTVAREYRRRHPGTGEAVVVEMKRLEFEAVRP
ncbi:methyltransferase domain-containing protein [Dissulfurirhabdus thermomarina]|uniref:Methyltransferase domain-containing protein n=1 Tax=Dissulfurirhabdus thermomarina TaxID=1765737 RepID=A0A6N9TNJ6_DISTH|nr:methyltransferase domain-containing protein [Dissulfurirhabdus thermomarina]NDY41663.1 methyltransferase domain-containing protein [Dissulfurirhabdus thermomarina]NMX24355.1 methyltransferase domain-containing protein [Dissulfurirhabdus thermomarina]